MPKKKKEYAPGDFVLVEHGSSPRGILAYVAKVENGLYTVSKYRTKPPGFRDPVLVASWKILGPAPATDPRLAAARAALGVTGGPCPG